MNTLSACLFLLDSREWGGEGGGWISIVCLSSVDFADWFCASYKFISRIWYWKDSKQFCRKGERTVSWMIHIAVIAPISHQLLEQYFPSQVWFSFWTNVDLIFNSRLFSKRFHHSAMKLIDSKQFRGAASFRVLVYSWFYSIAKWNMINSEMPGWKIWHFGSLHPFFDSI